VTISSLLFCTNCVVVITDLNSNIITAKESVDRIRHWKKMAPRQDFLEQNAPQAKCYETRCAASKTYGTKCAVGKPFSNQILVSSLSCQCSLQFFFHSSEPFVFNYY